MRERNIQKDNEKNEVKKTVTSNDPKSILDFVGIEWNRFCVFLLCSFLLSTSCLEKTKLNIFENYNNGLAFAKKENKNIFIAFDFYGNPAHSVEKLLQNNEIQKSLSKYVVIHLKVDGNDALSQFNKQLQGNKFKTENQPMYYIINCNEVILKGPQEYAAEEVVNNFIEK